MPASADPVGLDLMIVGAPKTASTSLFFYLGEHPQVDAANRSEFAYFVDDEEFQAGATAARRKYFAGDTPPGMVSMAKLAGLMYFPIAVERLHEDSPDVRVSVVLRNPVERAYSAYWFARRRGFEDLDTFEAALDAGPHRAGLPKTDRPGMREYVERGRYAAYLPLLFDTFGLDRVHVSTLEDLSTRPEDVVNELLAPFGLAPVEPGTYEGKRYNESATFRMKSVARFVGTNNAGKRFIRKIVSPDLRNRVLKVMYRVNEVPTTAPPIDPVIQARLIEEFRPWNARLGELLGRDFSHWDQPKPPKPA